MKRIGINAIGTRHSGAATVLLQLIEGLRSVAAESTLIVYCSPEREREFILEPDEKLEVVDAPALARNPIVRFAWMQVDFAEAVRRARCDAVINMNNLAGPVPVPQVLFIQQSRYFSPEALRRYPVSARSLFEPPIMRRLMEMSARACQSVVVQTNTMRDWATRWLALPKQKLRVVPPPHPRLSGDCRSSKQVRAGWRFLYVGNDSPYKNLLIIDSVASCTEAEAGNWTFLTTTERSGRRRARVQNLGRVIPGDLALLYSDADALVMPSLVETVGLPMMEAMASGLPVIAADRPYAREICGDAALYFDPLCPRSLIGVLEAFTSDEQGRRRMVERGLHRLRSFPDAREHAALWCRVLEEVTGNANAPESGAR